MSIDAKRALIIIEAGEVVEVREQTDIEELIGCWLGEFDLEPPRDEPEVDWLEVEFARNFEPPSLSSRPYRDEPEVCSYTIGVDWGEGEVDVDVRPLMWDTLRDARRSAGDFERSFAAVQELLGDDERYDELAHNITGGICRRIKRGR